MNLNNARQLVGKKLPGYKIQQAESRPLQDSGVRSAVEIASPSLSELKRRYFGDNAAPAPKVQPDSADSGIVIVKKENASKSSAAQAVVFSEGKIIGRQG